ncbi:MAG: XdhC family protein [Verrucomicrobiales bacterium]|nr:XdhC family protein [Verrucomicrobiales bacterium]
MNELQSILEARRSGHPGLDEAVLATVVAVKGSAYRRPGARMLIFPDGERLGTISGGCLESDVVRKANWWTAGGDPALRTFDTSSEQATWEFGLGCNGVITLLLERVTAPGVMEELDFLERQWKRRRPSVAVTVVRSTTNEAAPGDRLLFDEDGCVGGRLRGKPSTAPLKAAVDRAFSERASQSMTVEGFESFVEYVGPAQRLVVFGAGHDAIPLVAMAGILGWSVTVVDGRSNYARRDRFPAAESVVCLPSTAEVSELGIDSDTAVVLMTHNFPQDVVLLPQILKCSPQYLGLLGPRRRAERLFAEAGLGAIEPEVFAPVGLDLGGDHPETVALSIISEIQSVLSGRRPVSLRNRPGPIHGPTDPVLPMPRVGRGARADAIAFGGLGREFAIHE